jgi:hypothetical protein
MRLSELYYELTQMVANTKPGEDPPVYVKYVGMYAAATSMDFEKFYVDAEGDFIIEVS